MGCNCSRDEAKLIVSQQVQNKNKFIVKLNIPNTHKLKVLFYESNLDHLTIIELLNWLFFCSKWAEEIDANFLSVYNKDKDKFDYIIQRLMGYEYVSDESDIKVRWCVYINGVKEDLSDLFGLNRVVVKTDVIELKFEK